MTPRRLAVAAPLALLVAILAHAAGFGADHAPGADHARELVTSLGVALALLALATLLEAAFGIDRRDAGSARQDRWLPIALAAGGACAYAAIEFAEGHALFGGSLRALAAILPAAALIGQVARLAARFLRYSGAALAGCLPAPSLVDPAAARLSQARPVRASSADVRGCVWGRAPPLPA